MTTTRSGAASLRLRKRRLGLSLFSQKENAKIFNVLIHNNPKHYPKSISEQF
jgi:hypothetical protein